MIALLDSYSVHAISLGDAWDICNLMVANEDRFRRYFPKTLEQNLTPTLAKQFVEKKVSEFKNKEEFLFTLKEKKSNVITGLVYIKELDWQKKQGEFAYCIGYQYANRGVVSSAVKALSVYAFDELGLEVLQIIAHKDNMSSVKVAQNAGFMWQKTLLKTYAPPGEEPLDMELYELYKSQILKANSQKMKDKFYSYIQQLQDTITSRLEKVDGKAKFHQDVWERPEGGGGRTRVIQNGNVFEKGGVNISAVYGPLPDSMQKYFKVSQCDFFACGLSLVLHPKNPFVPTVHANWRYFEMYNKDGKIVDSWFGGGQDLTPYYLFEEDARHFHEVCKRTCDRHNPNFYADYKKKCDEYFHNAHRGEARGIGGLFFDYCKKSDDMTMQNWYDFVTEVGDSFLEAYVPIVERRKQLEYAPTQRDWQEIRRGRYVEFNLVHDKGTLFGLKTNGRIESILMSLPSHVQWVYDHHPKEGSEEEKLLEVLKNPKEWV